MFEVLYLQVFSWHGTSTKKNHPELANGDIFPMRKKSLTASLQRRRRMYIRFIHIQLNDQSESCYLSLLGVFCLFSWFILKTESSVYVYIKLLSNKISYKDENPFSIVVIKHIFFTWNQRLLQTVKFIKENIGTKTFSFMSSKAVVYNELRAFINTHILILLQIY